jgi:peptidoglycan/LPS O-acetylase OafA/YrhL
VLSALRIGDGKMMATIIERVFERLNSAQAPPGAGRPTVMRAGLSVYLDLLRFLAAIGVVICHAQKFVMPTIPRQIAENGGECVAIFFVLSGFVIRFTSVEKGETDWRTYAAARWARLFSVVPIALLVTLIADRIGFAADPSYYYQNSWYNPTTSLLSAFRALTFTNEIWLSHSIFSSNEPFWSLGFEVPYYIFFGILAFTRGRLRIALLGGWAVIFGPKILANLPLWLLGGATYMYMRRQSGSPRVPGLALVVVSIIAYLAARFALPHHSRVMYQPTSAGDLVKGATYYFVIGLIVAMNFVGIDRLLGDRTLNVSTTRAIRWLANGSFSLYLVHLPVMAAVRAWFPSVNQSPLAGSVAILFICVVAYSVAEFGERRKSFFKAIARRLFSPPLRPRIAAA